MQALRLQAGATALVLALACGGGDAKTVRSPTAKAEFQRLNPCPATGQRRGKCPGYVIDHVIPLKRGGHDKPSNMQWQTKEAAKAKDKWE